MIHDSKAEELEAKGLYRRAAARWADVMWLVSTDKEREKVAKRRAECIRKAARPPVIPDNFGGLREAANRTQADMGIEIAKSVWRNYQTDKVL
ncbi:PerC family transcriptional regulator [Escherichia coli]|nr:PerC family transcriptional regulator [Escherichia coli]MED0087500.1 PerC family transcriptional regulator [Escherichia coli]MED0556247.1 PerC family transcriptional regulator [Escherichia coli]MED9025067.1 PerC family transcriptional regulator [Escherichia coli]MED9076776.1 PerC family transcriptional regulator [Escherichia coli]